MHTHNIIFGAHACRNGKSILYTQGSISIAVTLLNYMLNQMYMRKASVGMYSGCDNYVFLRILFVYFLALPSLLHPSILFNCFYWGEPERAPHKRYSYARILYYIFLLWYVRHAKLYPQHCYERKREIFHCAFSCLGYTGRIYAVLI